MNLSCVFIDPELPKDIYDITLLYFSKKVDITTDADNANLVVCTSTNFVNKGFDTAFVIADNTIFDSNIKLKYFYNPGIASTKFFEYWLDRNFKDLNIPFLTENLHQTILLVP